MAIPPQAAPQGPAPEQGPQQGESPVAKVVGDIHDGLLQLMDIFQQAKLDPKDVQHLGGIVTSFQGLIEELSNPQGGDEEQAEAPQQGAIPEHGAKGSEPAFPQG